MKVAISCLTVLSVALLAELAQAGNIVNPATCGCPLNAFYPPYHPCDYRCAPAAPDACGPGSYCTNPCGVVYGPNHCVMPGFPPFNGARPPMPKAKFPTHPFARSPRDFFMVD